jgi:hypothetical protein
VSARESSLSTRLFSWLDQPKSTKSGRQIDKLEVAGYVNAVTWNVDGSKLAILSKFGSEITIIETSSWKILNKFSRYGGGYSDNSLQFLPDGSLLTSAPIGSSPDPRYKSLQIFALIKWDIDSGKPTCYIPPSADVDRDSFYPGRSTGTFCVSPDGSLVAGLNRAKLVLYKTSDWSLLKRISMPPTRFHGDPPVSLAFAPNNREIGVGTLFGNLHFVDLPTGLIRLSIMAYADAPHALCGAVTFSGDGRFIATTNADISITESDVGSVRIWRVSDGSAVGRLSGHVGPAHTASWDPKGNILAVGGEIALAVWHMDAPDRHPTLIDRIARSTYSVSFSPDALLAASQDRRIFVVKY